MTVKKASVVAGLFLCSAAAIAGVNAYHVGDYAGMGVLSVFFLLTASNIIDSAGGE